MKRKPPMYRAVENGDIPGVLRLISKGEDVNSSIYEKYYDSNGDLVRGYTYLHLAVSLGNLEMIETLLNYGANISAKTMKGKTPLLEAIYSNKLETIELLLKNGAEINKIDKFKYTPLHMAVLDNKKEIAEFLLKNGANVMSRNVKGNTPLHIAVWLCELEIVKLLVSHGADIRAENKKGETPYSKASNKKDQSIKIYFDIQESLPEIKEPDTGSNQGLEEVDESNYVRHT